MGIAVEVSLVECTCSGCPCRAMNSEIRACVSTIIPRRWVISCRSFSCGVDVYGETSGPLTLLCVVVHCAWVSLGSSRCTIGPVLGAVAALSGTFVGFVADTAWMRRCISACRRLTSAWSLSLAVESSSMRACSSLRVSRTDVRISTVPSAPC
ncbi:unnamed protein product [Ixodes hexagonus]